MSRVRVWAGPGGACRRSLVASALGAAAVVAMVAPSPASAFTAQPGNEGIVVATGDAADDVTVSSASDGRVVVDVVGQALSGSAGPCSFDPDAEQLSCPAGTAVRLELGAGDDTADASGGVALTAFGGAGNDVMDGAAVAHGEDGDDRIGITAGPSPRQATGDAGDDVIEVAGTSGGDVVVDGGDGRDTLDAADTSGAGVVLRGAAGTDDLRGATGPGMLDGGDGDDVMDDNGGAGSTVIGGAGSDTVDVSGTGSVVQAGDGDDRVDGAAALGAVRVDAGAGADLVAIAADGSAVTSGPGNDVIDAAGAAGAVTIDAGEDDDRVDVGGAGSTVRAGGGNDSIDASSASGAVSVDAGAGLDGVVLGGVGSSASGGDGDDTIDAVAVGGASHVDGGPGQDRIALGGSGSTATGGDGDDQLDASDALGAAALEGQAGADTLTGGGALDTLLGGDDDDRLDGGAGANQLDGGAGNDTLLSGAGSSAGETFAGGDGSDRVSYETALSGVRVSVGGLADDGTTGESDDVRGDVEAVDGSDGDDVLTAGPGGTTLAGAEGDDILAGGPAPDVLVGGAGDDRLEGGAGAVRDDFEGGEGADEVGYGTRTAPLLIDMRARDARGGEAGEGDVYRDPIERIIAGAGADVVNGVPGVAHVVVGGAGDDTIRVTEARGAGGDAAADSVRCQEGKDRVEGDRLDTVSGDCERVLEDGKLTRALPVFRKKLRMSVSARGNRLSVRIGCDRDTLSFCSTKVVVRRAGTKRTLARVERVHIQPGRYRTVRLKATNGTAATALSRSSRMLVVVVARDRFGRGSLAKHSAVLNHSKVRGDGATKRAPRTGNKLSQGQAGA